MRRWIYLIFGNKRWARQFLGGRWVRRIEAGADWIQWGDSILPRYLTWPLDYKQFEMEDWG